MVALTASKLTVDHKVDENIQVAQAEAPRFEHVTWYREPHLRKLYFLTTFLLIASATTGYDGMLVNTSQMISRWKEYFDFEEDSQENIHRLGILINMFNIGSIISFLITPYIADTYGRKTAIAGGCVGMIIGGCITAFATSWGMYVGGRFVLGFGNSLAQMSSPLLLTEICHPQHRGPLTAVYNCLWNLGSLLVSSIGWGTSFVPNHWSWRSITLIQIAPSIIQIIGIWFVPESPRYLINKDKAEDALNMLAKWHGGGDASNATVQFQYREIKETIEMEKAANKSTTYADFVRTKGNLWRLAIVISLGVISQYSGSPLFSNYMDIIYEGAGITEQNQKLAITTGKSILDLTVAVSAALTVDYFGRRPLFLTAITGMVGAFACWTITGAIYENSENEDGEAQNAAAGYAQLVFIWIFGIFYSIGFSGLLVAYALEVLPFHLRAKGMMILNITIQSFLALGNQTNKLAWENLPNHWNFMLFYTLWDLVLLVFVYFFYVETKGPTLEEIARIFDGDRAVVHIDLEEVEKEIHAKRDDDAVSAGGEHPERAA